MTKTTEEYMIWVDFKNTGDWEELLSGTVPEIEALEYYDSESDSTYGVKVTQGGVDVTVYFEELLVLEEEDYSDEVHGYDFQRDEAKASGHFS